MKLYREVTNEDDSDEWLVGYPVRFIKEVEITEDEIKKRANGLDSGGMNDFLEIAAFIQGAKWVLSKLKGDG